MASLFGNVDSNGVWTNSASTWASKDAAGGSNAFQQQPQQAPVPQQQAFPQAPAGLMLVQLPNGQIALVPQQQQQQQQAAFGAVPSAGVQPAPAFLPVQQPQQPPAMYAGQQMYDPTALSQAAAVPFSQPAVAFAAGGYPAAPAYGQQQQIMQPQQHHQQFYANPAGFTQPFNHHQQHGAARNINNTNTNFQGRAAATTPAAQAKPTRAAPAVPAVSIEPLRSLVQELQTGLVQRDVTTVATAPTPLPEERLRTLCELLHSTFATDRDLMTFVKESCNVELCLQVRDLLVTDHIAAAEKAAGNPVESLYLKDMLERRGAIVVSVVEVLMTVPTPCSHDEQARGLSDASITLTGFCPLMRLMFGNFDTLCATSRGCVALLRTFTSISTAPRPVDNMVRFVTARLEKFVFDAHANYLVSHVLCACTASEKPSNERFFEPIPKEEMLQRTSAILSLSATKAAPRSDVTTGAPSATDANLPARRLGRTDGGVFREFLNELVRVLTKDAMRVATHREGSHVLENALRHLPLKEFPQCADVLTALGGDVHALALLLHSPCGRHCIVSLVDTLATRGGDVPFTALQKCCRALDVLRDQGRGACSAPSHFDAIETALRRLPRLPQQQAASPTASGASL